MKKWVPLYSLSPTYYALSAALLFITSLTLLKVGLQRSSVVEALLIWILVKTALNFRVTKGKKYTFKTSNFLFHSLLAFVHLGLLLSLFTALMFLPLATAAALYLLFPLYIPLVLRLWMGKKIDSRLLLCVIPALVGATFTFDFKLGWVNSALAMGFSAGVLKALDWVGAKKLALNEPFFCCWYYRSWITLLGSILLLLATKSHFHFAPSALVLLGALLDKATIWTLTLFKSEASSSEKRAILNAALPIALLFQVFIFHTFPSLQTLLGLTLITLGLFLLFLQKNILPNPLYPL